MASWADDLKAYEVSKQALPVAFSTAEPVHRFTKGGAGVTNGPHQAANRREFNILSNTAQTRDAESLFRTSKEESERKQRERAVTKRLDATQHNYNILTMEMLDGAPAGSPIKGNQPPRGKMVFKDGNTFVSSAQYALEPDAWKSPPPTPRTAAKAQRALDRAEGREREFNIVTQEYRKDHDVKAEADKAAERLRINAAAMISMSERYNPLTCKYRHVDDERKAKEEEEAKRQQFKISEVVRRSDGGAFDILSNAVKDRELASTYEKAALRGVGQRSHRRKEWEKLRDLHEEKSDLARQRALNRVNKKQRDAEILSHGYDILCNRPFETNVGQDAANPQRLKLVSTVTPLNAFCPTSAAETIKKFSSSTASGSLRQLEGQFNSSLSGKTASVAEPRSSHERLFCHPSRTVAEKELRMGEQVRREELERQRLPSIGSGVVESTGFDPSTKAQTERTAAASARPAGGAGNLLDKNEMGKSGLKRVAGASSASGTFTTPSQEARRVSGAGAAGNNVAKTQLKPLLSRNLMANNQMNDSGLRSFF